MSRSAMILIRELIASRRLTGGGHRGLEHSVDTEAQAKLLLVRFQVDVAGTPLHGVEQDEVDQSDDRSLARLLLERQQVEFFLFLGDYLDFAGSVARLCNVFESSSQPVLVGYDEVLLDG